MCFHILQFRSPEEFKYEWQTEKIDVFSLGNVIYSILTESLPFEEMEEEDAQELVKEGILPVLKESVIRSGHPIDRVLVKAMNMCFEYDWRERARAYQVRDLLVHEMEHLMRSGYYGNAHEHGHKHGHGYNFFHNIHHSHNTS